MSEETSSTERLFFGFIKLNYRQQNVAYTMILIFSLGWVLYQVIQSNERLHQREVDRILEYNKILEKERGVDKETIIRLYGIIERLLTKPEDKYDTIINQNNKIINEKLLKK